MAREQARHRSLKHDQATPTRKLRARLEAAATVPGEALARLRNDFFSKSTRKPKASRMKLVLKVASKVAKTLERGRPPLPLSAEVLEGTAAVKEAGYKSAETYLVEPKLAHVEKGHGPTTCNAPSTSARSPCAATGGQSPKPLLSTSRK